MKLDMYEREQLYINEQKALRLKHGNFANKSKRISKNKSASKTRISSRDIIRAFGRSLLQEYDKGRGRIERNYEVPATIRGRKKRTTKFARNR